MSQATSGGSNARRHRRRLTVAIKESLRELRSQLSLLNHQLGTQLELRDVDLDCLDLVNRHGPIGPSTLARRAGLHPATMTGVLDRLERAGWVARERDPSDRRAVRIRALPDRAREVYRLYSGMNGAMDRLCAGYSEAELELIADFLRRTAQAGQTATDELTGAASIAEGRS
jgi:DNA-binding MarR family transcriptional regulator